MAWVPIRPGLSFKPITFFPGFGGLQLLLRLEPGMVIPWHRHTGEVHAFNISGSRRLHTGEIVGPGTYINEPVGHEDSWEAIGEEPCIIHVEVNGRIEHLDAKGNVTRIADAQGYQTDYLTWCESEGVEPHPMLSKQG
jgi:quercetin dioxygenase-like cupin family protein